MADQTPGELWDEPDVIEWAKQVLDDMVPKLSSSECSISIMPKDGIGDVKFWVELGASIMMDKPIIAVAFEDAPVPPKLALVANEIVRLPHGLDDDPEGRAAMLAALRRVLGDDDAG